MLLVQNKMLQLLADENVDLSEDAIISQVLGTRSGYATGQGKFVIPTTSFSRSHYQREDDSELALYKQELAETKERVVYLEDKIEQKQVQTQHQKEELKRCLLATRP